MITQSKETQSELNAQSALEMLVEGNKRFVSNAKANRNHLQQVADTSKGQYPFATILSCMDSRTSAELIFDQGFGDIFSIRVAGNVVNQDIIGSMEYATAAVGTKIIVVLGHTKCGAIVGACNHVELGNLTSLLHKINPAIDAETSTIQNRDGSNANFVANVTQNNVILAIDTIQAQSPIIAGLVKDGAIQIVGGVYDVETGIVTFY
jgi:carbonic anhydrase